VHGLRARIDLNEHQSAAPESQGPRGGSQGLRIDLTTGNYSRTIRLIDKRTCLRCDWSTCAQILLNTTRWTSSLARRYRASLIESSRLRGSDAEFRTAGESKIGSPSEDGAGVLPQGFCLMLVGSLCQITSRKRHKTIRGDKQITGPSTMKLGFTGQWR